MGSEFDYMITALVSMLFARLARDLEVLQVARNLRKGLRRRSMTLDHSLGRVLKADISLHCLGILWHRWPDMTSLGCKSLHSSVSSLLNANMTVPIHHAIPMIVSPIDIHFVVYHSHPGICFSTARP